MEKTVKEIFSEKLKELRQETGLTQTQLAKKVGISQAGIAKWETGDRSPDIEFVVILAKFFGVSTDYLLGLED